MNIKLADFRAGPMTGGKRIIALTTHNLLSPEVMITAFFAPPRFRIMRVNAGKEGWAHYKFQSWQFSYFERGDARIRRIQAMKVIPSTWKEAVVLLRVAEAQFLCKQSQ